MIRALFIVALLVGVTIMVYPLLSVLALGTR